MGWWYSIGRASTRAQARSGSLYTPQLSEHEMSTFESDAMKFYANGRSYDTASSTPLAVSRGIREPEYRLGITELRWEDTLYRTQKDALFVHSHMSEKFKSGRPVLTNHIEI